MGRPAPAGTSIPARYTARRYLRLVDEGVLGPDDRVELLEGVIVAMAPHSPGHAAGIRRTSAALFRAVGSRGVVSVQLSLIAGRYSVPEPDIAVLPGEQSDYDRVHPKTALLVVEVSESSLVQDRMTKAPIYAADGIPEYWIVNVRDDRVEIFRDPVPAQRRYRTTRLARRGERIALAALAGVSVAVGDLLPSRPT
jgi:Uma2 family endonuclease